MLCTFILITWLRMTVVCLCMCVCVRASTAALLATKSLFLWTTRSTNGRRISVRSSLNTTKVYILLIIILPPPSSSVHSALPLSLSTIPHTLFPFHMYMNFLSYSPTYCVCALLHLYSLPLFSILSFHSAFSLSSSLIPICIISSFCLSSPLSNSCTCFFNGSWY